MPLDPYLIKIVVLFGLGGLCMIFAGLYRMWHYRAVTKLARASSSWPSVPGKVVSTRAEAPHQNSQTAILPKVVYHYAAAGGQYRGSTIAIGIDSEGLGRQAAAKLLSTLQPGADVSVFYNPQRPHQAVLYPGVTEPLKKATTSNYILILIGFISLVFATGYGLS